MDMNSLLEHQSKEIFSLFPGFAEDSMLKAAGMKEKPSVQPIVNWLNPLTLLPITWSKMNARSSTRLLRLRLMTESSITSALKRLPQASVSKNATTRAASIVINLRQL